MKTLYSSTFLSIIIAFLTFLGMKGETITVVENAMDYSFTYIESPLPKVPGSESTELPIVIDIFYSFKCSGCNTFGLNTIPTLQEKYLENTNVDLKLNIVPKSDDEGDYYSAVAVKCAAEHGKYWEMHKKLFETSEPLSRREADLLGQELELPLMEFRECLKSGEYDEDIGKTIDYANQNGVTDLPTVLIDGYRLYGNQPVENIERIVNKILNSN